MMKINDNNHFVDYLFTLTDDVGILQHSKFGVPNPQYGYTSDDNARALILAVMLYENDKNKKYLKLIVRYVGFLLNAQNENGKFKNFMGYNRNFLEEEGSEDCFGRCMWGLGRTIASSSIPKNIKKTCTYMFEKSLKNISGLNFPKSKAYSIIGLSYVKQNDTLNSYISTLADSLICEFKKFDTDNWNWFEDKLTYSNSVLPWSLFRAYIILQKRGFLDVAIKSMNFIESKTIQENYFKPVGSSGWYTQNGVQAEYDEQPLEACEMILTYLDYYNIDKNITHLNKAYFCYNWYHGKNSKELSLIDNQTGGCYDGLCENGLNFNQGSESTISYGIAYMEIYEKVQNVLKNIH